MDDQDLLSSQEVARLIRRTPRRVRQIPARELPYRQLEARGRREYLEDDVAAYLERRTVRR